MFSPKNLLALCLVSGVSVGMAAPSFAHDHVPLQAQAAQTAQAPGTVVEVAVAAGSFNTLVAAVQAAGLVEALSGNGPFTVFAPTDEAFAALPAGTVQELLKPENKDKLVKILTYHVVQGNVPAAQVKSGEVATLAGDKVTFKVKDGKVKVNQARVIQADVTASNGVIHVIDAVILPPDAAK